MKERQPPVQTKYKFKILKPRGMLTIASLYPFRQTIEKLMEEGENFLAVDLKNITRIDSSALGLLRNVGQKLAEKSGILCVFNALPEIHEMFTLTDLQNTIKILADEKEFDDCYGKG